MRMYRSWISGLLGISMCFGCLNIPVSAEIKLDPSTILTPGPIIEFPIIKDLIIFQNSSDVQLKWKAPTLASRYMGAPAIGPDHTIYLGHTFSFLGSVSYVSAFKSDGTKKWSYLLEDILLTPPIVGPDGTIYVSNAHDNPGELIAIRPDGTKKWAFAAGDQIRSTPVFGSDGILYAASRDGILHALNPQNGSEIWLYDMEVRGQPSLATAPDGTIYAANGTSSLYAIKPNGTRKWTYQAGGIVSSVPAVGPDGTIFAGSADHNLYAILPSGGLKWKFDQGSNVFAPSVAQNGDVYVGSADSKLNVIRSDGSLKWQFAAGGSDVPPVLTPNGLVYTHSSSNKAIYALNPDGAIQWQYRFVTDKPQPLAVGDDGTLYDVSTNYPDMKNVDTNDLEHTYVMYMYALKVPVKTMTLDQTSLALTEGQTSKLTTSFTPSYASNSTVTWKSTNPNIASVDDKGNVSARLSGTVTITATSGDGPVAQCKITVTALTVTTTEVSSVVLNKTALFLRTGDSVSLMAKVIPDNATNQNVTWISSNPGAATVNLNGKVTALSPGSTDITVNTQDGNFIARTKVVVTAGTSANSGPFTDIKGNWATPEILRAYDLKVASGYPDFTFQPNANITRSEFTVMLMNGLKPASEGVDLTFTDTDQIQDWAAKAVKQAVKLGIISGYPDGTFRPTANITHAEMMSMVVKGLGITLTPGATTDYADDADIPDWAKPAASISGKNNLLGGTTGNNFAPSTLATRAEAVTAIVRMLDIRP